MNVLNKRYDPAVPLTKIRPHPSNPRQGDTGAICQSIEANGFYGACIVQESTGYILAGNHRHQSAAHTGASTVPVIYVECDADAAKRILIADNRSSDLADWNSQALAELLDSIRSDQGDLTGTLYDQEDYDRLISDLSNGYLGLNGAGKADKDDSDRVESQTFEAPNAVVKTGNCDDDEAPQLESKPAPEIPEEVRPLFDKAWLTIASEWQYIGSQQFRWLAPELTPGVAAWHFLRAKYCGAKYLRKLSLAFTPDQFRTAGDDAGSVIDLLTKISAGEASLLPRLKFALKDKPDSRQLFTSSMPMAGHKTPLDFPAELARDLIDAHCPEGGSVLDPCHGWGGRCTGFLLASKPKRYVGCDPSPAVHAGVNRLIATLAPLAESDKQALLFRTPFEDFETDEQFDFALTSPPYFDREKYDGDSSSFRRYRTFDSWVEGFYGPMITKVFRLLKPGTVFALQVGSQIYPLADTGKSLAEKAGFAFERSAVQVMSNVYCETEDEKSESVLLFRKPV